MNVYLLPGRSFVTGSRALAEHIQRRGKSYAIAASLSYVKADPLKVVFPHRGAKEASRLRLYMLRLQKKPTLP